MNKQMTKQPLRVRTHIKTGYDKQFDCAEGCDNACRWEHFFETGTIWPARYQMNSDQLASLNECSNACFEKDCKNVTG